MAVDVEQFRQLSQHLTGCSPLSLDLAEQYLDRLAQRPEAARLPELFSRLEGGEDPASFLADTELKELTRLVLVLWYFGVLAVAEAEAPTHEQYYSGLFWNVVHAHPPGLSGGYSGYWAYPPEN
jgi:Membrane bound FAD containing D-sorbitol dehydrogenase